MTVQPFHCTRCGASFELPASTAAKYPGWVPRTCLRCRQTAADAKKSAAATQPRATRLHAAGQTGTANLTLAQVLTRHHGGPRDGIFTDGACSGNPGPGGWGAVLVRNNESIAQRYGAHPQTTNNRMELTAIIEGFQLVPQPLDAEMITMWSDSQLCVRTINEWAAEWEKRGWRRAGGEVKNLDLVQRAFTLARQNPRVQLRWVAAHSGNRWNEYADALATAYLRPEL